jgi:transcriptional regulator with XRE-family HTH domain
MQGGRAKMAKIPVPDVLPNNLKHIRQYSKKSLQTVANDIMIEKNFLSSVESNSNNLSGKTNIRMMKYYDASFYQVYDIKDTIESTYTDWYPNKIELPVSVNRYELANYLNVSSSTDVADLINLAGDFKTLYPLVESHLLNNTKFSEPVLEYAKILSSKTSGDNIILKTSAEFNEKRVEKMLFDINFADNEDYELSDKLFHKGFSEEIVTMKEPIDNEFVRIEGNKLVFDVQYKIPKNVSEGDLENFITASELPIDSPYITIKDDVDELGNPIQVAVFQAIRPEINNLKYIRDLLDVDLDTMFTELGYKKYNGYVNFELGNQKISTKMMWRLVYKFKSPLELILNIDEYYFRFCRRNKKIVKPRRK